MRTGALLGLELMGKLFIFHEHLLMLLIINEWYRLSMVYAFEHWFGGKFIIYELPVWSLIFYEEWTFEKMVSRRERANAATDIADAYGKCFHF